MSARVRHRHRVDHDVRIDDRDFEGFASQSGYSMHAAARKVVAPIAVGADNARAVDQTGRKRSSAEDARIVDRVQTTGDVEHRDRFPRNRCGQGSSRCNAINRRDGDEPVHAACSAILFSSQGASATRERRAWPQRVSGRAPMRSCRLARATVLPLLDICLPFGIAGRMHRSCSIRCGITFLDRSRAKARFLPVQRKS